MSASSDLGLPEAGPAAGTAGDPAGWFVVGAIGVGVLYAASVHFPIHLRLPLLTPLVLGAIAGWGLGRWAASRRVSQPRIVAAVAWGLIAAGQIAAAIASHRLGAPSLREQINRRKLEKPPLLDRIEQSFEERGEETADDAEMRRAIERAKLQREETAARDERLLTFAGYLENRIPPQWGRWPPPGPEIFFGVEIALAGTLGAWLAHRGGRSNDKRTAGIIKLDVIAPREGRSGLN